MLCLAYSLLITYQPRDDAWFLAASNHSWIKFVIKRYSDWTSRVLIELNLLFFVRHMFLWRICNALAMTSIVIIPSYLLSKKESFIRITWLTASLYALIPVTLYLEAGLVATSTNYTWPIAASLIALYPFLKLLLKQQKSNFMTWICSALCFIYAINQEQLAVALLVILPVIIILNKNRGNMIWPSILYWLVDIIAIIVIALCPGNQIRFTFSVVHYFAFFETFSFTQKFNIGWSSTLNMLFLHLNFIYVSFLILLSYLVYLKTKKLIPTIISLFPLATLGVFVVSRASSFSLPGIDFIEKQFVKTGSTFTLTKVTTWIPHLLFILIILSIIYSIFVVAQNFTEGFLISGFLAVAVATRLMIGFSPSVWESGNRTYTILFIAIIFVIVRLVSENLEALPKLKNYPYFSYSFGIIMYAFTIGVAFYTRLM